MSQTSKISKRKHDFKIVCYRGEQVLLKLYGEPKALSVVADIWEKNTSCVQTLQVAIAMGVMP